MLMQESALNLYGKGSFGSSLFSGSDQNRRSILTKSNCSGCERTHYSAHSQAPFRGLAALLLLAIKGL